MSPMELFENTFCGTYNKPAMLSEYSHIYKPPTAHKQQQKAGAKNN